MTTKTKQHQMLCAVCGGELQETAMTHEERRGDKLYLFQNVPARACTACGEIWIDEKVLQQIDRLIADGVPVRKVETPVYDFPRVMTVTK